MAQAACYQSLMAKAKDDTKARDENLTKLIGRLDEAVKTIPTGEQANNALITQAMMTKIDVLTDARAKQFPQALQTAEALIDFQKLQKSDDGVAQAMFVKARVQMVMDDTQNATKTLEMLAAAYPQNQFGQLAESILQKKVRDSVKAPAPQAAPK